MEKYLARYNNSVSISEDKQSDTKDLSTAFIIGNGNSRSSINVEDLQTHGVIYGCNALYRTFSPDYLIAVDTKMIREITATGYHLTNSVWTNPNRYSREITGLNLFNPNLGWSSGPSALNLASTHGYDKIYILGFDYEGTGTNKDLVNNIYAGTNNYKKLNERATYYGNWTRQTVTCVKKYPNTKFIRIIETINSFIPDMLVNIPNLSHKTIDEFTKLFNLK